MRANVIVVALALYIACANVTLAACAKSRHLRVNGKDALWNYDTSGGINSIVADDEERVVNFSGIKRWLKELFKNWS